MKLSPLTIGFSPCPNDTFIFNALVHGEIDTPAFSLQKEVLADVETLNEWGMAGKLDITKLSFNAIGHLLDEYVLLRSGSALGRGCGPLLLQRADEDGCEIDRGRSVALGAEATIAVPGKYTTANFLFRMAYPECHNLVQMPFEKIMPAIVEKQVEAGVVIHESRFTFQEYGLSLIEDLGAWWENKTDRPIPLGGIAAKRQLGRKTLMAIQDAISKSIDWANKNRDQCMPYIKSHARELDSQVVANHIGLYVNDYSLDLGDDGMAAVRDFMRCGNEAGIFRCDLGNIFLS